MTVLMSGRFPSTGVAKTLKIRSDVDWVETINYTQLIASTQWRAVRHYWQRGMATNDGFAWFHSTASQIESSSTCAVGWNGAVYPGFTLLDTSTMALSGPLAVTAGTDTTTPVYSTANTRTLGVGGVVRLSGTAHTNLNGKDFSVSAVTANTSFTLRGPLQQAGGVVAGVAGFWRYVAPSVEAYNLFYPTNRVICNISQAANAVVTTLVDHAYTVGQQIRLHIPQENAAGGGSLYGMTQADGLLVTITATLTASTFTTDLDTTGFTAFTFPLIATFNANTFSDAMAVPVGVQPSNTATNLTDATLNQSYIGIVLAAGIGSPAGTVAGGPVPDVIYWKAGKSFSNLIE